MNQLYRVLALSLCILSLSSCAANAASETQFYRAPFDVSADGSYELVESVDLTALDYASGLAAYSESDAGAPTVFRFRDMDGNALSYRLKTTDAAEKEVERQGSSSGFDRENGADSIDYLLIPQPDTSYTFQYVVYESGRTDGMHTDVKNGVLEIYQKKTAS